MGLRRLSSVVCSTGYSGSGSLCDVSTSCGALAPNHQQELNFSLPRGAGHRVLAGERFPGAWICQCTVPCTFLASILPAKLETRLNQASGRARLTSSFPTSTSSTSSLRYPAWIISIMSELGSSISAPPRWVNELQSPPAFRAKNPTIPDPPGFQAQASSREKVSSPR
jgi:hypothetical protein